MYSVKLYLHPTHCVRATKHNLQLTCTYDQFAQRNLIRFTVKLNYLINTIMLINHLFSIKTK